MIKQISQRLKEINAQYHPFNEIWLEYQDNTGRIRFMYADELDRERSFQDEWLDEPLALRYLNVFEQFYCIDTTDWKRFFKEDPQSIVVDISWLTPTRKRSKGVSNASIYMKQAHDGKIDKRNPLSLELGEQGEFRIVDGNSTYHVARMIGLNSVLVKANKAPKVKQKPPKRAIYL